MKLLITGGHPAPALAIIETIKANYLDKIEIIFVGKKYNTNSHGSLSFEYQETLKLKIKFINLNTGRLTRFFSWKTLLNIILIPLGLIRAFYIVKKEKPDKIITFGGYIGLPIAISGYFLKIDVFTHEQTMTQGLTNRIIAKLSKKIFCSFPQTARYFLKDKVVVTGNPIRQKVEKVIKIPFSINKNKPLIYVTGGSLGSHSVNKHILSILPRLLEKFIIIHQTGNYQGDYGFERCMLKKKSLPLELQNRYYIKPHFSSDEIGYVYSKTDLVVGRSGANTFFELVKLKIPAILIPLPWSANNEQSKQAEYFKKMGLGEIFNQANDSISLLNVIEKVFDNINHYKVNFSKLPLTLYYNASEQIIKQIINI